MSDCQIVRSPDHPIFVANRPARPDFILSMKSHLECEIRLGNLLEQDDVEAIMFPTNTDLMLIGALGGAILLRGGREVEYEAQERGPIALGEATHTTAGSLPFRYIIHAAIIGTREDDTRREQQAGTFTSGSTIGEATLNTLDQAHILGIESIALPPVGVREADFPLNQCAGIMLESVRAFTAANPDAVLRRIVLACPDQQSFITFNRLTIERMAS